MSVPSFSLTRWPIGVTGSSPATASEVGGDFIPNHPGEKKKCLSIVPVEDRASHPGSPWPMSPLTSFVLNVFCDHHQINSYGQEEDIFLGLGQ